MFGLLSKSADFVATQKRLALIATTKLTQPDKETLKKEKEDALIGAPLEMKQEKRVKKSGVK